ncbi:adenosylcobinamide-phosphate synthase CbiB [Dyadobacter tibetensis]|uniref:adenosylcobinamide-phosphate synthase CbiB n=1 Tax=Dyadobacter tibetensis TaxID=1211851 RepID=UPI000471441C|nr:adenosylcobinamide-phosphate synthase CbiB [Dyadobacter tibetensis]
MENAFLLVLPLLLGYFLDLCLGDPDGWPHPVRVFGSAIQQAEKKWNNGKYRKLKGSLVAFCLVLATCFFFYTIQLALVGTPALWLIFNAVMVYYGLANRGLIDEGRKVFTALENKGLVDARQQLSRIVGRDTTQLSAQQIRIATLETLSENLSDGVVAPLFYYLLGGVPAMMAYKMINTLDSMIGYRNDRYELFGKFAARLDDVANYIPARLTALLMVLASFNSRAIVFIRLYAHQHTSPNAGYPEAALAGILNCRFGGPNIYHGVRKEKPFIGRFEREIQPQEIQTVIRINHTVCLVMVLLNVIILYIYHWNIGLL